jgi:hypothetical protein
MQLYLKYNKACRQRKKTKGGRREEPNNFELMVLVSSNEYILKYFLRIVFVSYFINTRPRCLNTSYIPVFFCDPY